jgi:hypothetical protein
MIDPVLRVQSRLTDRDRILLGWLYDHGVLTSFQIAHALFSSLDFGQRRLRTLHRLGLVARFRPQRMEGGSYPYHYVIDQLGARSWPRAGTSGRPAATTPAPSGADGPPAASWPTGSGSTASSPIWPATPAPTPAPSCAGGCRRRRAAGPGRSRPTRIPPSYAPISHGYGRTATACGSSTVERTGVRGVRRRW